MVCAFSSPFSTELGAKALEGLRVLGVDPIVSDAGPIGILGREPQALDMARLADEEVMSIREQIAALRKQAGPRFFVRDEPPAKRAARARIELVAVVDGGCLFRESGARPRLFCLLQLTPGRVARLDRDDREGMLELEELTLLGDLFRRGAALRWELLEPAGRREDHERRVAPQRFEEELGLDAALFELTVLRC
jgi:hypothetical protein